jgi:hypothetical protein
VITGILWLFVKLLVLAALYFGIEWLIGSYPDKIGKIWAAILILIGAIFVFQWLGAF